MVPKYTSTRDELSDGSKLSDCPYAPSDPRWKAWQHDFAMRQQGDVETYNRGVERANARIEAAGFGKVTRHMDSGPHGIYGPGGSSLTTRYYLQMAPEEAKRLSDAFIVANQDMLDRLAVSFKNMTVSFKSMAVSIDVSLDPLRQAFQQIRSNPVLTGILDESEPPHLIRGKPAPRPKQAVCAKHGQPKGSCRVCWR